MTPNQALEKIRAWQNEDDQNLLGLCGYYKIAASPDMFKQLALVLARDLYPEKKRRGRKPKWAAPIKGVLVVEIERLVERNKFSHGVEWACKQLSKREPWKSFLEEKDSDESSRDPSEALRQIYFDFREDRLAKVSRNAFKHYEVKSELTEWEKLVCEFVRNPNPV